MRNLAYLYQTLNENAGSPGMYDRYQQFIVKNADSLWANNRTSDYKFGLRWSGPSIAPTPPARHRPWIVSTLRRLSATDFVDIIRL